MQRASLDLTCTQTSNQIVFQGFVNLRPIPVDRHIVSYKLPAEELEKYWEKGKELQV